MSPDDLIRLKHIRDGCQEAIFFLTGRERNALANDRILSLALVKCIENVGEASSQLSAEFRLQHAQIPWRAAISMRNRLAHGYFDIDLGRVWDTVKTDIPPFLAQIEDVLRDEEQSRQ
jgi:uncharacterized protein with HEPN domain